MVRETGEDRDTNLSVDGAITQPVTKVSKLTKERNPEWIGRVGDLWCDLHAMRFLKTEKPFVNYS